MHEMAISHKTTRGTASSSYSFEHCTFMLMLMFHHALTNEPFSAVQSYIVISRSSVILVFH